MQIKIFASIRPFTFSLMNGKNLVTIKSNIMKTFILSLFAILFVQAIRAQTTPPYCGLAYYYDNAGNRITAGNYRL